MRASASASEYFNFGPCVSSGPRKENGPKWSKVVHYKKKGTFWFKVENHTYWFEVGKGCLVVQSILVFLLPST